MLVGFERLLSGHRREKAVAHLGAAAAPAAEGGAVGGVDDGGIRVLEGGDGEKEGEQPALEERNLCPVLTLCDRVRRRERYHPFPLPQTRRDFTCHCGPPGVAQGARTALPLTRTTAPSRSLSSDLRYQDPISTIYGFMSARGVSLCS
jgi:hypothetical protein